LQPDAFDLAAREARRRGVSPDQLVEEIVRTDLGRGDGDDLGRAARSSHAAVGDVPPIDAVALARDSRADLEARGA
jgi:hypothetical protein